MNFNNYEKFLDIIMPVIDKKFEHQKDYLACKKGCALCCKTVGMLFSQLEFNYLMEGFKSLDDSVQSIVLKNMQKTAESKENTDCPFLINKVCSAYKNRGLICRTFGLLLIDDDENYTVPFCVHNGLNYAEIFDETTQKIDPEKVKEKGFEHDPMFYSLSRSQFFSLNLFKELGLKTGESKTLKEWITEYIQN